MSAPRRPGDDRRADRRTGARRPDRTRSDDGAGRAKRPTTSAADEAAAKPARKPRGEGWAKAKPPREKPGRRFKPGAPKAADKPTPMREDGPRRLDDDAPRPAATRRPGERPARSAPPHARGGASDTARRAAKPGRAPQIGRDREADRSADRTDERRSGRREARGTDRPARTGTLRPAYGAAPVAPRPTRDESARPARARPAGDRPVQAARPAAPKPVAPGKQPNRAARRAEAREAAAPPAGTPAAAATPAAPAPFLPGSGTREPQRIAKLLARAGVASRREIERMIEERRIALNGVPLETPATILTSLSDVTVDGQPVQAPTATRLFLFHKPPGVLTAERDFSGRPTIYDRLPEDLPRVMPVGRLDFNTEGLLLLTTDGEFKRKLELPSTGIPRIYRARAYGDVTQAMLEDLSDGVEIEGVRYGPIDANLERRTGANVWIEMRITEGKNREVRRVLEYLGLQVSRLIRTAYGEFVLADLAPGDVVEVRQNDLVEFRKTLR